MNGAFALIKKNINNLVNHNRRQKLFKKPNKKLDSKEKLNTYTNSRKEKTKISNNNNAWDFALGN